MGSNNMHSTKSITADWSTMLILVVEKVLLFTSESDQLHTLQRCAHAIMLERYKGDAKCNQFCNLAVTPPYMVMLQAM